MPDIDFGSSTLIDNGTSLWLHVNTKDVAAFKELIHRGANLWPDAPPAIKQLADLLSHGKILQDYQHQDTSK